MLEEVAKLGLSGGIGVLIGISAVWWVEPTTTHGAALLVIIFIIVSTVVGGFLSYLKRASKHAPPNNARPPNRCDPSDPPL